MKLRKMKKTQKMSINIRHGDITYTCDTEKLMHHSEFMKKQVSSGFLKEDTVDLNIFSEKIFKTLYHSLKENLHLIKLVILGNQKFSVIFLAQKDLRDSLKMQIMYYP